MRRQSIRLIAAKELLDTLRDRRTLFVALVLPLLLYPALLLGLTQIIGVTQRNLKAEHQRVLLDVEGAGTEIADFFRGEQLDPVEAAGEDARLAARLRDEIARLQGDGEDDARRALRRAFEEHHLAGAVLGEAGFGREVGNDRQGKAILLFDSTDEASKFALSKVRGALAKYEQAKRDALQKRHPEEAGRLRFAESPVVRREVEVASSAQRGAYNFAPLLGMLIVIMALTGAFYPAVDLAAGEKERGTLETLLVAPVTRTEIVLGKFLAVWVIAVVTALLNLFVMGVTFSKLSGMLGTGQIAFSLPLGAVVAVSVILVPTAALFSAVALALSSLATSYKEGQHYMSPLFLVATPLAMVGLLPNIEIGYALALVPVSNVVLLVKGMLLGGEATGPAVVGFLAMAAYAALALWAAVGLFKRESVLFRTGSGRSFDPAALLAARLGRPREGQAILLFFITLALMFYLSSDVETVGQAVGAVLKAQLLAVLLPTLLIAWRARVNVRETFSLRAPRPLDLPVVACAAGATLVIVLYLQAHLMPVRDGQGFEKVVDLVQALPWWQLFLLLAVLPPLCEETLCRGFLLSSFRSRLGGRAAIVVTALLFGALHLDLYRFPATAAAGLMLGYVCLRTGSLFASILFHMVYNGIIALFVAIPDLRDVLDTPPVWAAAAGTFVVGGAVAYFERRAQPAGDPAV